MKKETYKYYVYQYLREDGTPYYIGKGSGRRIHATHALPGRPCIKPKDINRRQIITDNLSEESAYLLEQELIKYYGRKDLGTGILRNRDDGGKGAPACIKTPEQKQAVSDFHTGRKRSEETKKRISESLKNSEALKAFHKSRVGSTHSDKVKMKTSKSVEQIDKKSGKVVAKYFGANEAAKQTGVYYTNIIRCANGNRKSAGGYIWRYTNGTTINTS